MQIEHLVAAESGWRAVFRDADGSESQSRIIGWAALSGESESELVGVIVDPAEPSRIVAAPTAASPDGGSFVRYRYVPPEPPPPPPPPHAPPAPEPESTAEQVAKGILRRRR